MGVVDTATNIAICNQSLGLVGAGKITINTSSQNRTLCELYFADANNEILKAHRWNFASKRAFAIQTTNPLFGYENAFTKPSDCLKVWKIEDDPSAKFEVEGGLILTDEGEAPPTYNDDSVDYLAGQYISSDDSGSDLSYLVDTAFTSSSETSDLATYCTSAGSDYQTIPVEYVYAITDLSSYPPLLKRCVVMNLAISLMPAIKQNEKGALNLQAGLYGSRNVMGYLNLARSSDGQEAGGTVLTTNTWLNSRRGGRVR